METRSSIPEYEPPQIVSYSEADILEELGDAHLNPVLASPD
jgi:hypothetical protein